MKLTTDTSSVIVEGKKKKGRTSGDQKTAESDILKIKEKKIY